MFQRMGLSGLLLKMFGLWLFCRMSCILPLISGMISTSIRYSHYWSITLLLLLTFIPYSMYGSSTSIYERANENVFIFFQTFTGHVHRQTEIIKWGRLSHCLLCALL